VLSTNTSGNVNPMTTKQPHAIRNTLTGDVRTNVASLERNEFISKAIMHPEPANVSEMSDTEYPRPPCTASVASHTGIRVTKPVCTKHDNINIRVTNMKMFALILLLGPPNSEFSVLLSPAFAAFGLTKLVKLCENSDESFSFLLFNDAKCAA
jgi:hypothetical protein